MSKINKRNIENTNTIFERIQIFNCLSTKQKYLLVNCFKRKKFKKDEVIFKKAVKSNHFYIIQTGKVSLEFDEPDKKDIVIG